MNRQESYRYTWPRGDGRPTDGHSRPFWTIADLRWAHPNAETRGAVLEVLAPEGWTSTPS